MQWKWPSQVIKKESEAMFCELFPCGFVQIIPNMEESLPSLTEGSENPFRTGTVVSPLTEDLRGLGNLKVVNRCFVSTQTTPILTAEIHAYQEVEEMKSHWQHLQDSMGQSGPFSDFMYYIVNNTGNEKVGEPVSMRLWDGQLPGHARFALCFSLLLSVPRLHGLSDLTLLTYKTKIPARIKTFRKVRMFLQMKLE